MKDLKRVKHREYKHFTIMLIPYNNTKVVNIKIPHWIGHMLAIICLIVLGVLIFSVVRTSMLNKLKVELEEKQVENAQLVEQNNQAQLNEKTQLDKYNDLLDEYGKKSTEFDLKTKELEGKILEIEVMRESLYEKISEASKKLGIKDDTKKTDSKNQTSDLGNSQDNTSKLSVGGALRDEYAVSRVDLDSVELLYTKMETLNKAIYSEIKQYNLLLEEINNVQVVINQHPSVWPVKGTVTQEMEYRVNPFTLSGYEFHSGMDIAVPTGTPVKATADGVVKTADREGGYGNLVVISHGNGLETYYGHNSKLLVSVGDKVKMNDVIAEAGSTGRSTGPHVHYEVRLNGETQNPRNYLPKE